MLPAFVIGLREGVEAALIVGIIAAFVTTRGRRDVLRWMWFGVALAAGVCLAAGLARRAFEVTLQEEQQATVETVVALVAVAMVSYMIWWMRRHARGLKGDVESHLATALARGSVTALVAMAFLAVFREGLETAVFLVAVFDNSSSAGSTMGGALVGLALAGALGYALYRGGLRINLAKFFRVTGVVLVLVVAGLMASAAHSAHEAGWFDVAQGRVVDLRSIIKPDSVQSALATGMLGIQPEPVIAEVAAWFLAAVPLMLFVLWPAAPRSGAKRRAPMANHATSPA